MNGEPVRHPRLPFLTALAAGTGCLLIDKFAHESFLAILLLMLSGGLVVVPPLRQKKPWIHRIGNLIAGVLLWYFFMCFAVIVLVLASSRPAEEEDLEKPYADEMQPAPQNPPPH